MLRRLKVENYALIDRLELELDDRLNIITGETGAGKSILLGALGLSLLQFLCHNYSLSRNPGRIGCRAKWFILVFTFLF